MKSKRFSSDKSSKMKTGPTNIWFKLLTLLEYTGLIFASNWVGRILALVIAAFQLGK